MYALGQGVLSLDVLAMLRPHSQIINLARLPSRLSGSLTQETHKTTHSNSTKTSKCAMLRAQ
jgi:hypothetical protein